MSIHVYHFNNESLNRDEIWRLGFLESAGNGE